MTTHRTARNHRFGLRAFRRRQMGQAPRPGGSEVVAVSVSADVAEDFPRVAEALGDGFVVVADQPHACAVAVVGPVGPVGATFLHTVHPHPALVVVDHGDADPATISACIHAGAAAYLCRPSVTEVAECVRSVAAHGAAAVAS